jgi:hypothetical protein
MKNIQSRETGNLRYTTRRKTKHKHNTICVGHHYKQLTLIRHEPPYKQLVICGIRVIQYLLFCVIFCSKIKKKNKKNTTLLIIVCFCDHYVLPFTISEYPFGIFKLFWWKLFDKHVCKVHLHWYYLSDIYLKFTVHRNVIW